MGIEILPPDVNVSDHDFVVSAAQHPLRAGRGEGRRLRGGRGDQGGARGGRPVRVAVGLLRAGRCPRGEQEGDRGAHQVRRVRIDAARPRKGMLGVLEQAQGSGQKAQQDAQIGQGSIFDSLTWRRRRRRRRQRRGRRHSPRRRTRRSPPRSSTSPSCWPSRRKSIGLFISAHPLKQVREALRERVDCTLAEPARAQGQGLGHGRRHHHRRQEDPHPQRRPDDVRHARRSRGLVEILVFGKALAEYEGALGVDSVVLVRGRVDHKDADKTCLVVQTAEPFAPSPEEVDAARANADQAQRGAAAAAPAPGRRRAARLASSTTSSTCSATSPASPRSSSRSHARRRRRARCGSARPTAWRRRRRCAPSWSTCSARPPCPSDRLARQDRVARRPRCPARATSRRAVLLGAGRCASGPGGLQHAGQTLEARLAEEDRASVAPQLACADVGVPVDVGAQRNWRVVEVQRADRSATRRARRTRPGPRPAPPAVRMSKPEASRWQESRHMPSRSPPPAASIERRQLLEGAPERAARARGVLQVQRAVLRLRQRLGDRRPGALRCAAATSPPQRRAGVQDDGVRAERGARAQRGASEASDLARISGSSDAQFSR